MCRIAGIISYKNPSSLPTVQAMCEVQKHGGPDDSGTYESENGEVIFGHRRLSLIDTSACGHQPMIWQNNLVISYNGEIYNYKILKQELQNLGQQFHTESDTEVILAAYSQWGAASFPRLQGMFAFALWDKSNAEVLLVRDSAGIKPLYYRQDHTGLQFASEIRAMSLIEGMENDPAWPVNLLAYGHIPEPGTTLKDVRAVPKGCFMKYQVATKTVGLHSFKFYNYNSTVTNRPQALQHLRLTMQNAVSSHLIADVPVGVFLSGGIDSAVIAGLAAERHKNLNFLSLYFEDKHFSEKKYQDILLQNLNGQAHQYLLKQEKFEDDFPRAIAQMDMPSCDGINTWFISRYAKEQGLKAVLSGIGADEFFGGYPSFYRVGLARYLQQSPSFILQTGRMSRQRGWRRLPYLQLEGIKGIYLFLRGYFTPVEIARQLGATEKEVWEILSQSPVLPVITCLQNGDQASWMEANLYMQNQLLRDADVMGMAHGVEIRIPYLDAGMLGLMHEVAPKIKYGGKPVKEFLVDGFTEFLPPAIHERNKMGFTFPFTKWLQQSNFFTAQMEASNRETKKMYSRFLKGEIHWSKMLSLLHLHLRHAN